MYSLKRKLYISQLTENQRDAGLNVGFVYSLYSFLFSPFIYVYTSVNGQRSKGKRQQAKGNGQEAKGNGQQSMVNSQQARGNSQKATVNGQQSIGNSL